MCSIKRIRTGRRNVLADADYVFSVKSNHWVCFWLSAAGASTLFGWLDCCSGCSWVEKRSGGAENHWRANCRVPTAATKQDCEETRSPKRRSDWSNKWNVEKKGGGFKGKVHSKIKIHSLQCRLKFRITIRHCGEWIMTAFSFFGWTFRSELDCGSYHCAWIHTSHSPPNTHTHTHTRMCLQLRMFWHLKLKRHVY